MECFVPPLVPYPKSVKANGKKLNLKFFGIVCHENSVLSDSAVKLITDKLGNTVSDSSGYTVELSVAPSLSLNADGYTITVDEKIAKLTGKDGGGLYYAAVTFCQLVVSAGDGFTLPLCTIEDEPEFSDRGLMLENRYGSDFMTLDDYKKAVDYLSKMKYNELTIGVYGCWCIQYDGRLSEFLYLPLKSHPELETRRDIRYYSAKNKKLIERENVLPEIFEKDYFGQLIEYAKTKNIKIKPLFNSLGHNTLIPRIHPELSAKDENGNPTSHGFCVSDEAVYKFMFSIYDEIIDRYLEPNGIDAIEIGLDEVYAWLGEDLNDIFGKFEPYCKCEKCRSLERSELMLKYIIRVCKYLKSRGIKNIYIYHDMLFEQFDIVNEELVKRFKDEDIYDVVVLDWWCYTKESELFQKREINSLFRSIAKPFTGYYHWVIPMEYNNNIYAHAKLAKKHGFEGIESYSAFEYCFDRPFMYQADLSWNMSGCEKYGDFLRRYAGVRFPSDPEGAKGALDMLGEIMTNDISVNLMNALEYYWFTYVAEGKPYPRDFHGEIYTKINEERARYIPYFRLVEKKSSLALSYLSSYLAKDDEERKWCDRWSAIALHYNVYSEAYREIVSLHDGYNNGRISKNDVADKLEYLKSRLETLMLTIETVRDEANTYVYLRNHSITRQFYADMIKYFRENDSPEFSLSTFTHVTGKEYQNLR